jgi:hypothetical protein
VPTKPIIIFEGNDIVASTYFPTDNHQLVVVSFPSAADRQSLTRRGFATAWLKKMGIHYVEIKVAWNHWFQSPETEIVLRIIAEQVKGYDRIVTYGSSMGAYAAISATGPLRAHGALAISPQSAIDPDVIPWDVRWRAHTERIASEFGFSRDQLAKSVGQDSEIYVVADPWDIDSIHAHRILSAAPKAKWILAHGGGHPAGSLLREYKLLSQFVHSILTGSEGQSYWRKQMRRRRRSSPRYWIGLAARAKAQGQRGYELAKRSARIALALLPYDDTIIKKAGRLFLDMDDIRGALDILGRSKYADRPSFGTAEMHFNALLRANELEKAGLRLKDLRELDINNIRLPILEEKIHFFNLKIQGK